jgi:dipeptidyl aminopeptidase/acylaminoacyl peptidase
MTKQFSSPLRRIPILGLCLLVFCFSALAATPPRRGQTQAKKPLTFNAFFHGVDIGAVRMAPNGNAVVIETIRRDFAHNRFRTDLWLYRVADHQLTPLTTSGHDSDPQWSPNGRWVAFLSTRADHGPQVYVISPQGGGADLLTYASAGGVHTYAWGPDSKTIYYASKVPLTKAQKEAHKKKWHDVQRFMLDLRADNLYEVQLPAVADFSTVAPKHSREGKLVAHTPRRVQQIVVTPNGRELVYLECQRQGPIYITGNDAYKKHQIYVVNLAAGHPIHQLMHTKALAGQLHMAHDGKGIYFRTNSDIPGPYGDFSGRVYYEPLTGGMPTRFAPSYTGAITGFALAPQGGVVASGQYRVEVPLYNLTPKGQTELPSRPGEYQNLSIARTSPRAAFVYSTLTTPTEVYLADNWRHPNQALQITHFNANLANRDLPRGHAIWWKGDDGVRVQGMLIFPPGKYNAKRLPLFVLIHGGPEDADVNHWEADWYQWGSLAAAQGWLVFEPNYRGSSGYGDKFMSDIVPHIVSVPGSDILDGVQAVIRAGYADPTHMAIGGYSYGGYMTDWLITQTTEFKAAVTGAGAIENTANWGNDDLSYDDTYYLGGKPWQNEAIYNSEAAIWQFNKVKTPTHIVFGLSDHRVSTCEDYLLDRSLRAVGVPTEMLMFPGEHHGLGKNPWHGRIKVREELKWIRKYTKADVRAATK